MKFLKFLSIQGLSGAVRIKPKNMIIIIEDDVKYFNFEPGIDC